MQPVLKFLLVPKIKGKVKKKFAPKLRFVSFWVKTEGGMSISILPAGNRSYLMCERLGGALTLRLNAEFNSEVGFKNCERRDTNKLSWWYSLEGWKHHGSEMQRLALSRLSTPLNSHHEWTAEGCSWATCVFILKPPECALDVVVAHGMNCRIQNLVVSLD